MRRTRRTEGQTSEAALDKSAGRRGVGGLGGVGQHDGKVLDAPPFLVEHARDHGHHLALVAGAVEGDAEGAAANALAEVVQNVEVHLGDQLAERRGGER